tara:strand:+ start:97 stop:1101 length:1005 start_codon:yes stop_codon:yes gene_type:complete
MVFFLYVAWAVAGCIGFAFWCVRIPVLFLPAIERGICELPLASDFQYELAQLGMTKREARRLSAFLIIAAPWMFTIEPLWYRRTEGVLLSILMYMRSERSGHRHGNEFASKLFWKRLLIENGVQTPALMGHTATGQEGGRFLRSDLLPGEGVGAQKHVHVCGAVLKPLRGTRGHGVRRVDLEECDRLEGDFLVEEEIPLPFARHTRVITLNSDTKPVLVSYRVTDHASDLVSNGGTVERVTPPRVTEHLTRVHRTDARLQHVPVVCWDVLTSTVDDAENGVQEYVLEGNWPGGGVAWKIVADDVLDSYRSFCDEWLQQRDRDRGYVRVLSRKSA